MRANYGGINHLHRVWDTSAVGERFEKQIPYARPGPSEELSVHGAPLAEFIGQVTPWRASPGDPEYTVQNAPVIAWRATSLGSCLNQNGLEKRPFSIRKPSPNQFCLLSRGSLELIVDSHVNHFVNTT